MKGMKQMNTGTVSLESTSPGAQSVALGGTVVAAVLQFANNGPHDTIRLNHMAVTARCLTTPPAAFPFVCRSGDPVIVAPLVVTQTGPDTWQLSADATGYPRDIPAGTFWTPAIVAEAQLGATDAIGSQWTFGVEAVADAHFVDTKHAGTTITTLLGTPAPTGAFVTITA